MSLTEADKKVLQRAKEYLLANYPFENINQALVNFVLGKEIASSTNDNARKIYLWDVLLPVMKRWLKTLEKKKSALSAQMRDARRLEQFHQHRTD